MRTTFFPTRIVDVGVPGVDVNPVLIENAQLSEPYVALSHQWGASGLPKTTLANIEQRTKGIPLAELTNTMKDAISIVRRLGYRYLWIDVLCIIQDANDDWLAESAKMSEVFRSAILTLAVADSQEHSDGIFRDRRAECIRPIRFEEFRMPRRIRSWFDGEGALYILPSSEKVGKGVRPRGPLDSRGWVLQEQLLSPRILYYGAGELFWDCISGSASESCPDSSSLLRDDKSNETWALKLIRKAIAEGDNIESIRVHMSDAWMELITNYSSRKLTKPSDKLVAIEGILDAIRRIFGRDAIIAGMWRHGLWRQLSWWSKSVRVDLTEKPNSSRFVAPSWSWLSADGSVGYNNTLDRRAETVEFRELVSAVQIEAVQAAVFSRQGKINGELRLSGYTFPYRLQADDLRKPAWRRFNRRHLNTGQWWLDEKLTLPQEITCLVLAEDEFTKMLICLCLVPLQKSQNVFKRVGLCHWEGMRHDVHNFIKSQPEKRVVTLV